MSDATSTKAVKKTVTKKDAAPQPVGTVGGSAPGVPVINQSRVVEAAGGLKVTHR